MKNWDFVHDKLGFSHETLGNANDKVYGFFPGVAYFQDKTHSLFGI
jgi:hypothetical protein